MPGCQRKSVILTICLAFSSLSLIRQSLQSQLAHVYQVSISETLLSQPSRIAAYNASTNESESEPLNKHEDINRTVVDSLLVPNPGENQTENSSRISKNKEVTINKTNESESEPLNKHEDINRTVVDSILLPNPGETQTENSSRVSKNKEVTINKPEILGNRLENVPESSRVSNSDNSTHASMAITDCATRQQPIREWYRYADLNLNETATRAKKRLLIAQYSGYGKYARLLELTSSVNKAYAKKWNHDLLILQGITLTLPEDGVCEPPPERARYNKIELLKLALSKNESYDQLLLLDADAIMYDLDLDITTLVADQDLLAAHAVSSKSGPRTWNINNGCVLWNLGHHLVHPVADEWYKNTAAGVAAHKKHGDQHYLQVVLKEGDGHAHVQALLTEFKYEKGTVVKHFLRAKNSHWNNTRIDEREESILGIIRDICTRHQSDCEKLEYKAYT
jgi:hypothetical protein